MENTIAFFPITWGIVITHRNIQQSRQVWNHVFTGFEICPERPFGLKDFFLPNAANRFLIKLEIIVKDLLDPGV